VKRIIRLLFHVLAHIYHTHFKEIVLLNLHSHLNCIFAHLVLFNDRFKLVEDKEVEVLEDLAVALKLHAYLPSASETLTPSVTPEPSTVPTAPSLQDTSHQVHSSASSSSSNVSNSKDGVITAQCRSISPFINNNVFDNKGINAFVESQLVNSESKSEKSEELQDAGSSMQCPFSIMESMDDSYITTAVCEERAIAASLTNRGSQIIEVQFHDPNYNYNNRPAPDGMPADFCYQTMSTTVDNAVGTPRCLHRHHDLSRRSTSASAILLSCSSEPSLPSVSLHETRRSNSSGTNNGHNASHPYNNYQSYHRTHASANRGSLCGLDANSVIISSTAANSSLKFL